MFAIIETGGKQIKVEEGQVIFVVKIRRKRRRILLHLIKYYSVGGDSVKSPSANS